MRLRFGVASGLATATLVFVADMPEFGEAFTGCGATTGVLRGGFGVATTLVCMVADISCSISLRLRE